MRTHGVSPSLSPDRTCMTMTNAAQLPNEGISSRAIVRTSAIGTGCSIGDFAVVAEEAVLGDNCLVHAHAIIERGARIAEDVVIEAGARVGAGALVGPSCVIGANASLAPGITLGTSSRAGACSAVSGNVPPYAIVAGNPASIVSYGSQVPSKASPLILSELKGATEALRVPGVSVRRLPYFRDMRGSLNVYDFANDLPFVPRRSFITYGVPNTEVRGEHAHRTCHQFLICTNGAISVMVANGREVDEVRLDSPSWGLHMPPLIWGTQYKFSADAVLLVFASEPYSNAEYIRDFEEYLRLTNTEK